MDITIFEVTNIDGTIIEWVQIDRGNGEFTSMPKAVWDELEAAKENGTTLNGGN
jgi:hypothetical protein